MFVLTETQFIFSSPFGAMLSHSIRDKLGGKWDFLVAVVIIQKLAEEWLGLHLREDSLLTIQLSHGVPVAGHGWHRCHLRTRCALQARTGPRWSLLQCWGSWAASKSHVKLAMKLTRHCSGLLPTIAARVPCVLALTGVGNWSTGGKGEEAEILGLRHIMFPLDMCPHVLVSWRAEGAQAPGRAAVVPPTSGQGGKSKPLPLPWHHIPWEVLRAAPAPSFLGFFLLRTKEDIKTCRTCGHCFGAELLLPKGEPSVPSLCHNCAQGKEG